MTGAAAGAGEVAAALRRVATPVGLPGSGRLRYGAAMTLHAAGVIGFDALEVYRILSMTDAEDPARLLAIRRLRPPPAPVFDPAAALLDLAEVADAALSASGAGEVTLLRRALAAARLAAPPRPRPAALSPAAAARLAEALADATDAALAAALGQAAPALGWVEAEGGACAALLGPDAPFRTGAAALDILLLPPGARQAPPPGVWLPLRATSTDGQRASAQVGLLGRTGLPATQ